MPEKEARLAAVKLLRSSHLMVVASATPTGEPHAALISYVIDDDWNIYYLSRAKTRKTEMIADNPQVSFTVGFDLPVSIQGWGRAVTVIDKNERAAAFERLSQEAGKHDSFWPPPLKLDRVRDAVIKIEPLRVRAIQVAGMDPNDPDNLIFVDVINRERR
jgi:nitroimidazol reductase NimA-like FMN-containing flavoprotein (pyridoxamine 5'-phosphate oxidase superfamily)